MYVFSNAFLFVDNLKELFMFSESTVVRSHKLVDILFCDFEQQGFEQQQDITHQQGMNFSKKRINSTKDERDKDAATKSTIERSQGDDK